MKKFFALMLVVFMIALVGTAMAAEQDDRVGGHGTPTSPDPQTDPDTGSSGSGTATTAVATETKTVSNVVVIVTEAIKEVTPEQVKQSITESVTASLSTAATDSGMSQEDIAYWTEQAEAIELAVKAAFEELKTTVGGFEGAEVQDADQLVAHALEGKLDELIAQESAKLQDSGQTAVSVLPVCEPKKSGIYKLALDAFKKALWGLDIIFNANGDGGSTSASIFASAVDGKAVFFNSKGQQVTKIPDGSNGEMPGFVTAAVYMEAGKKYKPVIATTTAAAQAKTDLTQTKASVQVTEEVLVASTSTFSTYVKSSLIADTPYSTIPASAVSTAGWADSDAEAAYKTANSSFDVFTLVAMPSIAAPNAATWYIAAVSFDRGSKTVADLFTGAELEFFPNNVLSEPDTDAVFLQESDGVLVPLDVEDVFGASSRYTRGYVAFQLSAAASKPAIATFVTKAGGGDTPSGPDTPTPVNPVNPGSSGGGCDAGFGALALAVLGAFMVTRRK